MAWNLRGWLSVRRRWHAWWIAWAFCAALSGGATADAGDFDSRWNAEIDRTWIGPDYWANRLQDWRIVDGRVECLEASPQRPMRTLQLLTADLSAEPGELLLSVRLGTIQPAKQRSPDTWAGVLLGAGGKSIDPRITALVHHHPAEDGGIVVAVDGSGRVIFRDNNVGPEIETGANATSLRPNALPVLAPAVRTGTGFVGDQGFDDVELRIEARPLGEKYSITATALNRATGKVLSAAELRGVAPREVEGGVALVSHLGSPGASQGYWFREWKMSGRKVVLHPERAFGPVFATQYTLHRGTLKLTAQLPPLGPRDADAARLEVRGGPNDPWRLVARARLAQPGYILPFRVEKWDAKEDQQFRVVYDLYQGSDRPQTKIVEGLIRRPPTEKGELSVAAFHGNKLQTGALKWHGGGLSFPHRELTGAVAAQNPDLLVFAGDQVQINDFTGAQRAPLDKATLDYLDKWYRWCWAFGDLTRQRPTVCIPGQQDYFHAQLWGAAGRAAKQADDGGFTMPAEFVNLVQRTQTSHLPDPIDPRAIDQAIDVFFTRFDYAGVSFAILEDRKFKSSPTVMIPEGRVTGGRFQNPKFDPARLGDVAGAELLGDRQLRFLREWAADWSHGVWMKATLSQGLFAEVATQPRDGAGESKVKRPVADYPTDDRLVVDATSNAWPQTGRNAALREIRKGFAMHLAGDQPVSSVVRYGIDQWDDAGYAFSVPSIGSQTTRRWFPADGGANRPAEAPKYTGQFKDGFGNLFTVLAAANPTVGKEATAIAASPTGFGVVKFARDSREIRFESWTGGGAKAFSQPSPGWPVVVRQIDNYSRPAQAHLPEVQVTGLVDPVIQVVDEANGEIVYTLRIRGESYRPPVFHDGAYTVRIGEPGTPQMKLFTGLQAGQGNTAALTVDFADAPRERVTSEAPGNLK